MRFEILNKKLFFRKLCLVGLFSVSLIPLLHYKFYLTTQIYIGLLLILHLYFIGVYLYKVEWKELLKNKKTLVFRFLTVFLFGYLLTLVKLGTDVTTIFVFLGISFFLHAGILCALMVKISFEEKVTKST